LLPRARRFVGSSEMAAMARSLAATRAAVAIPSKQGGEDETGGDGRRRPRSTTILGVEFVSSLLEDSLVSVNKLKPGLLVSGYSNEITIVPNL
jgi:hypothetical protein